MVKRHLKRHASPSTWRISRKAEKFVVRPRPGGHPFKMGMSIAAILKQLDFCETTREVKKALSNSEVFVNGRQVKDFKYLVGLMDVLSIPKHKLYYRMSLDDKGKLAVVQVDASEASTVPCRVRSVCIVKGGKVQLNCHNGYNIELKEPGIKPNDTIVYDVEKRAMVASIPLQPGVQVLFTGGGFAGKLGSLLKVDKHRSTVKVNNEEHTTPLRYLFVVGEKEPIVKLR